MYNQSSDFCRRKTQYLLQSSVIVYVKSVSTICYVTETF